MRNGAQLVRLELSGLQNVSSRFFAALASSPEYASTACALRSLKIAHCGAIPRMDTGSAGGDLCDQLVTRLELTCTCYHGTFTNAPGLTIDGVRGIPVPGGRYVSYI